MQQTVVITKTVDPSLPEHNRAAAHRESPGRPRMRHNVMSSERIHKLCEIAKSYNVSLNSRNIQVCDGQSKQNTQNHADHDSSTRQPLQIRDREFNIKFDVEFLVALHHKFHVALLECCEC